MTAVQPRSAWRARAAKGMVARIDERAERRAFVVHWLGPAPSVADAAARLRQAQAYHLDHHGWADLGYNLAVGNDGSAWEGRGWSAVGAHAPGYNRSGYGCVVLIGQGETATEAARATLAELYREACGRAGRQLQLLDHGGTGRPTACAGPQLRELVATWRRLGVPQLPAPVVTPTSTAPPKPPPAAPDAPTYPGRPIRLGARGGSVRRWQQRMADRGWRIAVDGQYGPASVEVCRAFQAEKRLSVDGVVGPNTWRATWAAPVT